QQRNALQHAARRRDVGWKRSGRLCGWFQDQSALKGADMNTMAAHFTAFMRRDNLRDQVERIAGALAGPATGFALLLVIWKIISLKRIEIPGPESTLLAALELFSDPFYDNGPNDVGIGWNILASLGRVALGFVLAAAVGIPTGFLIGRVPSINAICSPVIS